jgi:hypothetical protein
MANQPHQFKQRDVERVIRAARAGGIDVDSVTVNPRTGEITVAAKGAALAVDDLDAELAAFEERHGGQ